MKPCKERKGGCPSNLKTLKQWLLEVASASIQGTLDLISCKKDIFLHSGEQLKAGSLRWPRPYCSVPYSPCFWQMTVRSKATA